MTLTPEPSQAWPPERLRIGDCAVDVPLREVTAPGARRARRITPKALGVLLVLARQPGRVVSREALLDEVWPDTLPTNDVVTQAITQLRKAFDEQRGEARYIETIAKNGYRLLAQVRREDGVAAHDVDPAGAASALTSAAPLPGADALPAPAPRVPPPRRAGPWPRWPRWPIAAAVAAVALLAVALLLWRREAPEPAGAATRAAAPAASRPYQLITSAPGFELNPSLSPDGAMVAYAASLPERLDRAILVQTTGPTAPRQLTRPEPGSSDRMPAWSPDGREIAFQRVGPGRSCQIRVLPASGGPERVVAGCDPRDMIAFSWTPDGRGLLFGSMRTPDGRAGIRVLDLGSGRWRAIDYPTSSDDLDYLPRYSPDGRWIGFVRNPQLGDLWLMPAEGGTPRPLTRQFIEVRGWDWLPDSRGVAFGRRVDSETRLYRVGLDGGAVQDLGVYGAQSPSVAAGAGTIAFVNRRPKFDLFRFPLLGRGDGAPGEHLFPSTGRDVQASIAPDATQLVFGSDRTGSYGLWWADLRRPDSLRLFEGLLPDSRRLAEWSWDSRRVLVTGTGADGRYGLHELLPASGQVERLPVPLQDPIQGLYLPDPGRLLVGAASDDDDGRLHLTLYDRSGTPWRALQRVEDVSLARVDPDRRRVLFTRTTADGLWQADLDLSPASVRVVDAAFPSRWRYRNWDIASDGRVFYVDLTAQCQSLLREIATATPAPTRCLQRDRLAATNGISVSGRNGALYVPLATGDGTDIAFMPLPSEWNGPAK